jgi:hypothetical protein
MERCVNHENGPEDILHKDEERALSLEGSGSAILRKCESRS